MAVPVVKTMCGKLAQNLAPETFTTPTHNYYKVLGDTSATYHYLEPKAAKHYINITKTYKTDVTVVNGGVINPFL